MAEQTFADFITRERERLDDELCTAAYNEPMPMH
jgi:hypothetical protein